MEQLDIRKILGILTARHLKDRLFDLFVVFCEYKKFIQYADKSYGISRVLNEEKKERKSFTMLHTINPTRATGPLLTELEDLSRRLEDKLRRYQMTCCHVGVTVKFNGFTVVEKSMKLQDQTCDAQLIYS